MANVLLASGNWADEATLAGGGFTAGLPRDNLKDPVLGHPARTSTDGTSDTQFTVAFTAARPVRVVGLCRHNLSVAATYRIRSYDDASFTTVDYDSGTLSVWPAGYVAEDLPGYNWDLLHVLAATQTDRWWKVELTDTSNPDNYVQIGRLFMADGWQPATLNMLAGASLGYQSRTNVDEAWDGTEHFDERQGFRVARFALDAMATDEAMTEVLDLQRVADIHKEVVFIYDPDDTTHRMRRWFLGRLRTLSPIDYGFIEMHSTAFEIKERL